VDLDLSLDPTGSPSLRIQAASPEYRGGHAGRLARIPGPVTSRPFSGGPLVPQPASAMTTAAVKIPGVISRGLRVTNADGTQAWPHSHGHAAVRTSLRWGGSR
jgi:hypothetical protein